MTKEQTEAMNRLIEAGLTKKQARQAIQKLIAEPDVVEIDPVTGKATQLMFDGSKAQ